MNETLLSCGQVLQHIIPCWPLARRIDGMGACKMEVPKYNVAQPLQTDVGRYGWLYERSSGTCGLIGIMVLSKYRYVDQEIPGRSVQGSTAGHTGDDWPSHKACEGLLDGKPATDALDLAGLSGASPFFFPLTPTDLVIASLYCCGRCVSGESLLSYCEHVHILLNYPASSSCVSGVSFPLSTLQSSNSASSWVTDTTVRLALRLTSVQPPCSHRAEVNRYRIGWVGKSAVHDVGRARQRLR